MSTTTSDQPLFGGSPTSGVASTSTQNLFPTQSSTKSDERNGTPNVYYLVFLGILLVLLILAGCLALRAVRMRRRYRTATQIALARGDPLPVNTSENYWGLSGLAGWTSEGFDRLGNMEGELNNRRQRERDRETLKHKPKIYDEVIYKDEVEGESDVLNVVDPISIQSLLPLTNRLPNSPQQESLSTRPLFGFRQRPYPIETFPQQVKEVNRSIESGVPIRMGLIIQMPTPPDAPKHKSEWAEDEEVGWDTGMELGIWQGKIHNSSQSVTEEGFITKGNRESTESEIYR
ncbi:uncharacterized protein I206_106680 [Kwoniella pini CBS 10737]|uniref:Uncharacterized protein n=1 Tax=Kwoniella pini CBS 10737 TaxID=1296096 RepID=A0A1B9HTI2_9TREE|nr:uncharacterized protein I206_07431 [Kwoniella pini CBS 10737]OCF46578.1 hypothetical protein I206_07431 [Kwoniella pini CBS 10737]